MNFSKALLGKELNELTYQGLEVYFKNPRIESNTVEYKSYNSKSSLEKEFPVIYRSVCALLNSDGGIIIWGAPKGQSILGRKEKEFSGNLSPINNVLEKDYLINKVSDNIAPLPNDINVEVIVNNGNCVVAFEVQKSSYVPHQTSNNYYMRLDGQSRIAPHHYIEALFKQIKYPNLGGYVKLIDFNKIAHFQYGTVFILKFTVGIFNHSPLQNEENILFRLVTNPGFFDNELGESIGSQFRQNTSVDLLHYGTPYALDLQVYYDPKQLKSYENKARLILFFGGKYSPMKKSDYQLNLFSIDPKELKNLIIGIKENELMYEFGKNRGTEEEKVNLWKIS